MSKDKVKLPANEQEQKIEKLRAAIIEGEASGPAIEFDMEEFLSSKRDDPFVLFTEWSSNADEKTYNKLKT